MPPAPRHIGGDHLGVQDGSVGVWHGDDDHLRQLPLPDDGPGYDGVAAVVGVPRRPHGEGGQVVSTEYNREILRMRNAETVLNVIRERGERGLPLEHIYRLLYNRNLYLRAYGRIYSNQGATTKGITAETMDGMSLAKIDRIIEALPRIHRSDDVTAAEWAMRGKGMGWSGDEFA